MSICCCKLSYMLHHSLLELHNSDIGENIWMVWSIYWLPLENGTPSEHHHFLQLSTIFSPTQNIQVKITTIVDICYTCGNAQHQSGDGMISIGELESNSLACLLVQCALYNIVWGPEYKKCNADGDKHCNKSGLRIVFSFTWVFPS